MTTAIIILALIALIVIGIARAIRNYNSPKNEKERTERLLARLNHRERWRKHRTGGERGNNN